jgi:membrane-bound ClpP family serine protease
LLVFATIFAVGFLLLIFNLIFGSDVADDIDAGDVGDAGEGPSVFSLKMLALLMVGFGSVGFGVTATTEASMFVASAAGIGGAIVVGVLGYVIIRAFYSSQASSTITAQDIVDSEGNLIDGIGEGGVGQVVCVVRGREITYLARSRDGKAINRGAAVKVIAKVGNTVTVERIE